MTMNEMRPVHDSMLLRTNQRNTPMKFPVVCVLLMLFLQLSGSPYVRLAEASPNFPWHQKADLATPKNKERKWKWTSMLTVDPAKILSILVRKGGLFIPKYVEKDLDVLRTVCACEKAELNVVERQMILYNFTIGLPNRKSALRVGRVYVYWDSYIKPCIDIEVDEVDILVEFTNLMLTKNNWNELKKLGFPPDFEMTDKYEQIQGQESFVRFNSIDLSKNITLRVESRPLQKGIGVYALDMDATDDMNHVIRNMSDMNLVRTGRRGCSSTEVSDVMQAYFTQKIRRFLADAFQNVASDPAKAIRQTDSILNKASESILGYAGNAGRKKGEDIQGVLASKLEGWGFASASEKLSTLTAQTIDAVNKANASSITPRRPQPSELAKDRKNLEADIKDIGDDPDTTFPTGEW